MPARASKWFADCLWRLWYPFLTRLTRDSPVVFLNYGYVGDEALEKPPALKEEDESNRVCIQLYDHVARAIDLRGLNLLEVSCGHGGGAAYVARYLNPESVHGVDRNAQAIQRCQSRHEAGNLTFSHGNAMALDLADDTFDVVMNVEASHCYPDVPRFFREIYRVLRPGGHFLYADFRSAADRSLLDQQLEQSGLHLISCEDISPSVVRGMRQNTETYLKLIEQLVPRPLRSSAMRFAGVKGSAIYNELASGATIYLFYHLQKRKIVEARQQLILKETSATQAEIEVP